MFFHLISLIDLLNDPLAKQVDDVGFRVILLFEQLFLDDLWAAGGHMSTAALILLGSDLLTSVEIGLMLSVREASVNGISDDHSNDYHYHYGNNDSDHCLLLHILYLILGLDHRHYG